MDQATSPYQKVLRHVRERRQGANLDAVSAYVLVAIIKKRLNLNASFYTLLQVFSVTLFEKIPLNKGLFNTKHILEDDMNSNQLNLFNN